MSAIHHQVPNPGQTNPAISPLILSQYSMMGHTLCMAEVLHLNFGISWFSGSRKDETESERAYKTQVQTLSLATICKNRLWQVASSL